MLTVMRSWPETKTFCNSCTFASSVTAMVLPVKAMIMRGKTIMLQDNALVLRANAMILPSGSDWPSNHSNGPPKWSRGPPSESHVPPRKPWSSELKQWSSESKQWTSELNPWSTESSVCKVWSHYMRVFNHFWCWMGILLPVRTSRRWSAYQFCEFNWFTCICHRLELDLSQSFALKLCTVGKLTGVPPVAVSGCEDFGLGWGIFPFSQLLITVI